MGAIGPPIGRLFDIPDFTISGVLPPYLGMTPANGAAMSPYQTTLARIAGKLCGSPERKEIFRGLIAYRQQLADIGLSDGFQWLSGSFMEDIEGLETRHPNDVDVVTFCHRPPGAGDDVAFGAFFAAHRHLLDARLVKPAFKCDSYLVDLNMPPTNVVNQARYWFGLFSHRRGGLWKGMLQIPLSVTQDDADASVMVGP